jgi:hypothetical protein
VFLCDGLVEVFGPDVGYVLCTLPVGQSVGNAVLPVSNDISEEFSIKARNGKGGFRNVDGEGSKMELFCFEGLMEVVATEEEEEVLEPMTTSTEYETSVYDYQTTTISQAEETAESAILEKREDCEDSRVITFSYDLDVSSVYELQPSTTSQAQETVFLLVERDKEDMDTIAWITASYEDDESSVYALQTTTITSQATGEV